MIEDDREGVPALRLTAADEKAHGRSSSEALGMKMNMDDVG